jgi:hypothetical protein
LGWKNGLIKGSTYTSTTLCVTEVRRGGEE